MVLFSEIVGKDVINVRDGFRLGHIQDLKINIATGEICAVMLPGPSKFMGLLGGNNSEYWIEWSQICKIGADIILVDVDLQRCLKDKSHERRDRKGLF
ncbi:MAG: YlmC/YmxH family sporulation protein [Firmicutes bacterium]|nr:YlmC/YmxH family sporulation protein [Bacillota bacterium]